MLSRWRLGSSLNVSLLHSRYSLPFRCWEIFSSSRQIRGIFQCQWRMCTCFNRLYSCWVCRPTSSLRRQRTEWNYVCKTNLCEVSMPLYARSLSRLPATRFLLPPPRGLFLLVRSLSSISPGSRLVTNHDRVDDAHGNHTSCLCIWIDRVRRVYYQLCRRAGAVVCPSAYIWRCCWDLLRGASLTTTTPSQWPNPQL